MLVYVSLRKYSCFCCFCRSEVLDDSLKICRRFSSSSGRSVYFLRNCWFCMLMYVWSTISRMPTNGGIGRKPPVLWSHRINNAYGLITSFCVDPVGQNWMCLTSTNRNVILWDLRCLAWSHAFHCSCFFEHPLPRWTPFAFSCDMRRYRCKKFLDFFAQANCFFVLVEFFSFFSNYCSLFISVEEEEMYETCQFGQFENLVWWEGCERSNLVSTCCGLHLHIFHWQQIWAKEP